MKEKTTTITYKYDKDGKLIEKTETIVEKGYQDKINTPYVPYTPTSPSIPNNPWVSPTWYCSTDANSKTYTGKPSENIYNITCDCNSINVSEFISELKSMFDK